MHSGSNFVCQELAFIIVRGFLGAKGRSEIRKLIRSRCRLAIGQKLAEPEPHVRCFKVNLKLNVEY